MTSAITRALHVIALSDKGVRVAIDGSALEGAFWLPRGCVIWAKPPQPGTCTIATVPDWLAAKHRQFNGHEALEAKREYQRPIERNEPMADQRDMSGSLSKNLRKEKPSHADYAGSIVIAGRKYWLNGWVKDGEKGKFLSLSAKPAEEPKPAASRASFDKPADEEIPF
jgi:hypothetical protein